MTIIKEITLIIKGMGIPIIVGGGIDYL